jgi:hypothetical protein
LKNNTGGAGAEEEKKRKQRRQEGVEGQKIGLAHKNGVNKSEWKIRKLQPIFHKLLMAPEVETETTKVKRVKPGECHGRERVTNFLEETPARYP